MKNTIKKLIILIVIVFPCISVWGQALKTNYFMPSYSHRHMLNPALLPQWGYVYIPAVGPLGVQMKSNLGLSNFLFPLSGTDALGSFLHPDVSSKQFLNTLSEVSYIDTKIEYNPISFAWYWGSSFWSVDIGLRANVGMRLPKELFRFMKEGMSSSHTNYRVEDMAVKVNAYLQAAIGYGRVINEEWTVGGKLKFLSGMNALINVDHMNINMSEDKWSISSQATAKLMGAGMNFQLNDSTGAINGVDFNSFVPGGYGAAIDLGFEYRFHEISPLYGLHLSFGVTDLGAIFYPKNKVNMARTQGEVVYEGFENVDIINFELSEGLDQLSGELFKMLELREMASSSYATQWLNTTMSAGIEYSFLRDKMSIGLLSTTRFGLPRTRSELTFSYNLRPANWFALSASYTFVNTYESIGFALHLTPKWGLNLFLGCDYLPLVMSPQFIPLRNASANFYFGLNIPIGNNTYRASTSSSSTDLDNVE